VDREATFDQIMRRFCEEVLAVCANGLPIAGWYPDPYGRMHWRWWDGTGWTKRAVVNSQEVVDPDYPRPTMYPLPTDGSRARPSVGS